MKEDIKKEIELTEGVKANLDGAVLKISGSKGEVVRNLIHPKILKIEGTGLMLAPILKNKETTSKLIYKCIDKGLLLFWLLWEKKAIRISPPLTISKSEIVKGCKIICESLDEI